MVIISSKSHNCAKSRYHLKFNLYQHITATRGHGVVWYRIIVYFPLKGFHRKNRIRPSVTCLQKLGTLSLVGVKLLTAVKSVSSPDWSFKRFSDKTQFYGKKHKEKVRIPNPVDLAFEEEIHLIMVEKYSNDEKITRLLITSTAEELQTARNMKKGFGRRRLESFLDRFGYSYQPRAQVRVL